MIHHREDFFSSDYMIKINFVANPQSGHDDQFHYIKRANKTLLWISIFYLMCIAFIPFFYSSDRSIWRSTDLSNHLWNQYNHGSV